MHLRRIHCLNSDWIDEMRDAVEYVYRVFGTEKLVIFWGNDSIRPPLEAYPAMNVG